MPDEIIPPENTSPVPDNATKEGLPDFTGENADRRVLRINFGFFKYGTDDKIHAAAIVLSISLLVLLVGIMIYGAYAADRTWADKMFSWVGGTFLFVTGVALGKGSASKTKGGEED